MIPVLPIGKPEARPPLASEVSTLGPSNNAAATTLAAPAPRRQPRTALVVRITDLDRAVVVSVVGEASTDNLQPLEIALVHLLAGRIGQTAETPERAACTLRSTHVHTPKRRTSGQQRSSWLRRVEEKPPGPSVLHFEGVSHGDALAFLVGILLGATWCFVTPRVEVPADGKK